MSTARLSCISAPQTQQFKIENEGPSLPGKKLRINGLAQAVFLGDKIITVSEIRDLCRKWAVSPDPVLARLKADGYIDHHGRYLAKLTPDLDRFLLMFDPGNSLGIDAQFADRFKKELLDTAIKNNETISLERLENFERISGKVHIALKFQAYATGLEFPLDEASVLDAKGAKLFIKLEPWSWLGADDPTFTLKDLLAGKFDHLIERFAEGARRFGKRFYLSPVGHEMNGSWYPWRDPADFVAAWKYFQDKMTALGVDTITYVWNPNIDTGTDMDAYWPGNDRVDVIALDGYCWGTACTVEAVFEGTRTKLLKYGKEMWIGETGAYPDNSSTEKSGKPEFLKDLPRYCVEKDIKCLLYFNFSKEGEWAISSPLSQRAYKNGMSAYSEKLEMPIEEYFGFKGAPGSFSKTAGQAREKARRETLLNARYTPCIFTGDNGTKNVVFGDNWGKLYLVDDKGRDLPGWPINLGTEVHSSPAVIEDNGTRKIIVSAGDGRIYMIGTDGYNDADWKAPRADKWIHSSPTVTFDPSGSLRVISGSNDGSIRVFDRYGAQLWDHQMGDWITASIAVSDIDGDGEKDLVAASWNGKVRCLSITGSTKWTFDLDSPVLASPAVADLDMDGKKEVIVAASSGRVTCISAEGGHIWTKGFPSPIESSPSIADIDASGTKMISFGCGNGDVYLLDRNGGTAQGFPKNTGDYIEASPSWADLDGNGSPDMIVPSWNGTVNGFNISGEQISGFPYSFGKPVTASSAVADLDGNGIPDVVTLSGNEMIINEDPSWRSGPLFSAAAIHRADNDRTGYYPLSLTTTRAALPPAPSGFNAGSPHPNPFINTVSIGLSGAGHLRKISAGVYDILGRLVKELKPGSVDNILVWDGTDRNGNVAPDGSYFMKISSGNDIIVRHIVKMR